MYGLWGYLLKAKALAPINAGRVLEGGRLLKMCVMSLLCGARADLRPFYGFYVNGFLSIKRFTKVGHSSEVALQIHRRKTAVNSLQLFQSPPNSA